jgi:superfamily I DNA/RNA helicase
LGYVSAVRSFIICLLTVALTLTVLSSITANSFALGQIAGEAVQRLRAGKVIRSAGYDGVYGKITLFEPHERDLLGGQLTFLDMAAPKPRARRAASAHAAPASAASAAAPAGYGDNPEQRGAITSCARAIAVVAGPGTGKTHTLVSRIEHLISEEHVKPCEITAVTFTNHAAAELKQRLEQRLGGKRAVRGLTVGTFHSIALGLIPQKPLVGRVQAIGIIKSILAGHESAMDPTECLDAISALRNGAEATAELPEGIVEEYRLALEKAGVRDLGDVIAEALDADVSGLDRFKNLFIDEYQDINSMQRRLVAHWAEGGGTIFAIGDPDQSIYGFRGASAGCFDELRGSFPELHTITLVRNYRSAAPILNAGLSVIAHNPGGERRLEALRGAGDRVRLVSAPDVHSEAHWIAAEIGRMVGGVDMVSAAHRDITRAFSDIAILCRTRSQLSQIEAELAGEGIPCMILGRSEGLLSDASQGILGLFRHIADPGDSLALKSALRGIWRMSDDEINSVLTDPSALAATTFPHVRDVLAQRITGEKPAKLLETLYAMTGVRSRFIDDMAVFHGDMPSLMENLVSGEESDIRRLSGAGAASGAVTLMTLHGSKGLEFPVVFLAGAEKGALPLERRGETPDAEEERRLFFVGITRARDELIISHSGAPSPFIGELPKDITSERAPEKHKKPLYEQLSFL